MIGKTRPQTISWGSRTHWAMSRPAMSQPSRAAQRSRASAGREGGVAGPATGRVGR